MIDEEDLEEEVEEEIDPETELRIEAGKSIQNAIAYMNMGRRFCCGGNE